MTTAVPGSEAGRQLCWCCGATYPEAQIIRLGTRPEAGVCLNCTISLRRTARERMAADRGVFARRAALIFRRGRESIMERQWHQRPVIGPALRWINRHLP
jgi:hypothetical protein